MARGDGVLLLIECPLTPQFGDWVWLCWFEVGRVRVRGAGSFVVVSSSARKGWVGERLG